MNFEIWYTPDGLGETYHSEHPTFEDAITSARQLKRDNPTWSLSIEGHFVIVPEVQEATK